MRCCARDGGDWPSSVGLRGQALNHPELRWLKTVVVSVREKAHKMRQVGARRIESLWFAPSIVQPIGMPCRSVAIDRLAAAT